MDHHASLRERVIGEHGVVMLIGASDTGKTTLGKELARDALAAGRTVAYVDADIGAATVGPPACVGMTVIESTAGLQSLHRADELRFVGSTKPEGVVLPHTVAAAAMVERAKRSADFIVLDTTSVVAGVVGQTLKYHLCELAQPALVIAMQRGNEMEPIIGMVKRFLGVRVARSQPRPSQPILDPVTRNEILAKELANAFSGNVDRWRVQPNVFAPTLPEGFDLSRLHEMLVGVQGTNGRCLGLGVLEYSNDVLRVVTPHGENMNGLRLGSMRVDLERFTTTRVRLRELFFSI